MTDEERQRTMDFILNQQAQFAVNMQKSEERQAQFEERQAQFEERQAQFDANMQKLEVADSRSNKRIDRLERVLKLAISSYRRERKETREKFDALVNAQTHTEDVVANLGESHAKLVESHVKLAESQAHADKRLDALIGIVRDRKQ